ncbi:competence protein ComGA [Gracilibacillus ureilyticus]|uniref:Competence protein ComGA n=1 Tax=Gracilibacillus ureilyticus TaxID=531814 RepID=A0A1H9LZF1_9BACI|nr:competence type IV pilus ATPase ComGA [Gracilibacillus ureilyticus]SER16567.1 competence protein ComGA [Gracilibacillus ureilyticus]
MKEPAHHIILDAISQSASDIHFHPTPNEVEIHFRINGQRHLYKKIALTKYKVILAYFKYTGKLDIGESRLPQQGSLSFEENKLSYSLRISTLPANSLESLAIRILPQKDIQSLHELFLFPNQFKQVRKCLKNKSGIILLTGPTGSGKTTTLYAILKSFMEDNNYQTITLEDPVEKSFAQAVQVQINPESGLTYDEGLKAALRHDPDIIMVGEIRDQSTAEFVFRAAYTGHLVLSTLHAKDTFGTILRLLDMGIKKLELEQSLLAVASLELLPLQLRKFKNQRAAIIELLEGEILSEAINKQLSPLTAIDFQKLRRKAFAYGYISEENCF